MPFVVTHHGPHTDRASPSYSSVPERFKRGQGDHKVDGEVNEVDRDCGSWMWVGLVARKEAVA